MQTVNVGQGGRAKRTRMPCHAMYVQCSASALPQYDKVFASSLCVFLYRVVTRLVIFMAAERPVLKIAGTNQVVQITDDNSRTLMHPETGVAFHSASGALAETRHVYLHNSGVQKKWNLCEKIALF